MKPKEKADEIFKKMYQYQWRQDTIEERNAKQCALIAVDEILEILWHTHKNADEYKYYQEVKKEIENL